MKRELPYLLNTFCYVTILVLLSIIAIYADCMNYMFPLDFVWYSMANGAVSALLSLLFLTEVIIKECAGWLRMLLFIGTLYASVTALSFIFNIVTPAEPVEIITMLVIIALIFFAVFFTNRCIFKQQEKELTDKLNEFQASLDDE